LVLAGCFTANVFGGEFENNLNQTIQSAFKEELQVLSVDKLKSIKGLSLVILKNKSENALPLYVSEDGKSFLVVSQYFYFADSDDNDLFLKKMEEIQEINKQAADKQFDILFDSIPQSSSVLLKSSAKTDDLLTIVTDPDCPYCRAELANLREHLKSANVRLIISPTHNENAYIKGALILEESKKLKSTDTEKIIAVFEKYYKDIELDDKQLKTDTSVIHGNAEKIFGSGLIRGVPYIHHGKLK
jgi:thiol:disulfide interchange protein DsbC